jgi:hypothetical protein
VAVDRGPCFHLSWKNQEAFCDSSVLGQHISPEENVKGFKSLVYSVQWMGLLMMHYAMTIKRMGMLVVSARNVMALAVKMHTLQTMKMERVILMGKGI